MMHLFDILLIGVLAWIAIGSTSETKLFKSIVMFVVFGLFMSLAWIRLGSPDVALAEAAIGSGVTGVLLLDAAGHLRRRPTPYPEELAPGTEERTPMRSRIKLMPLLASLAALVIIATTVIGLPPTAPGLSVEMSTNAETIHVKNVVTAVLLDFRGYDTLLEISVLMLATVAVLSLRVPPGEGRGRLAGESGLLLGSLAQLVAPFMIVIAGFLVWVGSSGPGGAFQAGAVPRCREGSSSRSRGTTSLHGHVSRSSASHSPSACSASSLSRCCLSWAVTPCWSIRTANARPSCFCWKGC